MTDAKFTAIANNLVRLLKADAEASRLLPARKFLEMDEQPLARGKP